MVYMICMGMSMNYVWMYGVKRMKNQLIRLDHGQVIVMKRGDIVAEDGAIIRLICAFLALGALMI